MKHTEATLSKYPKVRKIINPKTVICICSKKVHLDRNYDPDLLDHHVKKKICKSSDGNSQITQFCSTQDSETSNKRKLCIGLNDKKGKLYLRCISFVTTFGGRNCSTDNTKLEEKLHYSASLGAILRSTFLLQETLVSSYDEIDIIVKKIQTNNAIANMSVHIFTSASF